MKKHDIKEDWRQNQMGYLRLGQSYEIKLVLTQSFLFEPFRRQGRNYGGGGGQKRAAPPTQNFPPKLPSMPTQTSLFLTAVLRWWLFFGKPTENSEKSRPNWRDDLFFFWDQQRTGWKLDQPKNFGLSETNFSPLVQRSSCGTVQRYSISDTTSLSNYNFIGNPDCCYLTYQTINRRLNKN